MSWQTVLKRYELEEFIIKAPKKKSKKGEKTEKVGNDDITIITPASLDKVMVDFDTWFTTCKAAQGEEIGVTGRGNQGKGKISLLEHVMFHVDGSVQRPGQGSRHGAMKTLKEIKRIIEDPHPYTKQELKRVNEFIDDLEEIEDTEDTNPRNIPFQVPDKVGAKGAISWKEVRGHYRTPEYIKHRQAKGKKESIGAVDGEWYSDTVDTAEPPFWMALFKGFGKIGSGDILKALPERGLLNILRDFRDEMEEQKLSDLHIKGKFQRQEIEKLKPFTNTLKQMLNDQSVFRDPTGNKFFTRLHLNFAALKRKLGQVDFQITSEAESEFVKRVTGHGELIGKLESFKITNISIQLLRTIMRNKANFNLDTIKHGTLTGIFLVDPIRAQDTRKALWNKEFNASKKANKIPGWARPKEETPKGKPEVKKSWGMTLFKREELL